MTSLVDEIRRQVADPRVRLAMLAGAFLEGGNASGPWQSGDNGHSWGPFQINGPSHPNVTPQQANDPATAVKLMAGSYSGCAGQQDWSDPANAVWATVVCAENPDRAQGYAAAGPQSELVRNAYTNASSLLGGNPLPASPPGDPKSTTGTGAKQDACVAAAFAQFPEGQNYLIDALRQEAIKKCIGTTVNSGQPFGGVSGILGNLLGTQQFVRLLVIAGGVALVLIGVAAVVLHTEAAAA